MKKALLPAIPLIALAAGAAWHFWPSPPVPVPVVPAAVSVAPSDPPPGRTVADPVALFKRAFWRDPSAGDEIPHALRHEWSDAEGITRWEWFLEVKASPELLKYLREDNTFGLRRAGTAAVPDSRPSWFAFDSKEVSVLKSPRGNLQLIFSREGNRLLACDSGHGFQRGAAAAALPVTTSSPPAASGRLPTTSPPIPSP